ncbi:ABC transporter permease [Nonomuraea sp. NPDC049309]|uniref:ABC transporter permease n=1 Tax=Nonomuraea sp. NPDC049309 TaxID=3364350 RepID=UPI003720EDED
MSLTATYRLGTRLFWSDRANLFASVITPVGLAVGIPTLLRHVTSQDHAAHIFQGLIALVLSITAFMSVTVTLTARRDQLVLKRLRASELTDRQILAGQIAGAATQSVVIILLCTVAVWLTAGIPLPAHPVAFIVAALAGSAAMALLGAALTAIVPRAELASVYAIPVFMISSVATGAMGPIPLPGRLQAALDLLPTSAAVHAIRTGELIMPLLDIAAWTVLGLVALRLWFRWEPRRS